MVLRKYGTMTRPCRPLTADCCSSPGAAAAAAPAAGAAAGSCSSSPRDFGHFASPSPRAHDSPMSRSVVFAYPPRASQKAMSRSSHLGSIGHQSSQSSGGGWRGSGSSSFWGSGWGSGTGGMLLLGTPPATAGILGVGSGRESVGEWRPRRSVSTKYLAAAVKGKRSWSLIFGV